MVVWEVRDGVCWDEARTLISFEQSVAWPAMSEIVLNVFTGSIIAVLSAWVTVRLSLERFRREKWWERKADAYERIITALHYFDNFAERNYDAAIRGKELDSETDRTLRDAVINAKDEVNRLTNIGALVLPDEAIQRLNQFQREAKKASETTNWITYLEVYSSAVQSCLADIIKIARNDLSVK